MKIGAPMAEYPGVLRKCASVIAEEAEALRGLAGPERAELQAVHR